MQQRYLIAPWRQKLDAMTRILETTDFNAMLIFVRTKVATLEVSEKLEARGHASAALNGDMTADPCASAPCSVSATAPSTSSSRPTSRPAVST